MEVVEELGPYPLASQTCFLLPALLTTCYLCSLACPSLPPLPLYLFPPPPAPSRPCCLTLLRHQEALAPALFKAGAGSKQVSGLAAAVAALAMSWSQSCDAPAVRSGWGRSILALCPRL